MFLWQILLNSLVLGTQVLLLAVSLYLVYSVSKIYHLALGAIGVAAAYGLYFGVSHDFSWTISIAIGVAVALVLSALSYFLLEGSSRRGEIMLGLLLSLAVMTGLEAVIAIAFHTDAKSIIDGILPTITYQGLYLTLPGVITLGAGAVLAVLFAVALTKTPWGRNLRGVAENSSVASSIAVNPSKIRLSVYLIAGVLAGLISVLTSMNTALTPRGGFNLIILGFVAMMIGGVSDIRGLIIASYLITLIPQIIINFSPASLELSANWNLVIVFVLATLILLWRPQGLLIHSKRQD